MIYLKWSKGKTYNQEYSTQQASHSDSKEKSQALQTSKSKIIQCHQSSFTTNAKEMSLDGKGKATTRNKTITNGKANR